MQAPSDGNNQVNATSSQHFQEEYIGTAEMLDNRAIVLNLSLDQGGMVGDATKSYPPSDPDYAYVLKHVGPISPGQVVRVKPFPK